MKILFINESPNENGNTATLADILLKGKEYEIGMPATLRELGMKDKTMLEMVAI